MAVNTDQIINSGVNYPVVATVNFNGEGTRGAKKEMINVITLIRAQASVYIIDT